MLKQTKNEFYLSVVIAAALERTTIAVDHRYCRRCGGVATVRDIRYRRRFATHRYDDTSD